MQNHSYRNVAHLHVHFHANQTQYHMKDFVQTRFEERYKVASKYPITFIFKFNDFLCEKVVHFVAVCKQILLHF